MSDHCFVEITFRTEDKEALSTQLGHGGLDFWDDSVDSGEGWRKVAVMHANYGWHDELTSASKEGLVFYGFSGQGGDYPSQLFVSFGGKLVTTYEISHFPAARIDDFGKPMEQDMKDAREYQMLWKLATKHVEEGPDANSRSQPPA